MKSFKSEKQLITNATSDILLLAGILLTANTAKGKSKQNVNSRHKVFQFSSQTCHQIQFI